MLPFFAFHKFVKRHFIWNFFTISQVCLEFAIIYDDQCQVYSLRACSNLSMDADSAVLQKLHDVAEHVRKFYEIGKLVQNM
jgi:hypothetical protein